MSTSTSKQDSSTLQIRNRLSEISRMSQWINDTFVEYNLPDNLLFNFDLCANEAVTNIINYAFPDKKLHQISLELTADNQMLTLRIIDDGIKFNPLDFPYQKLPDHLDKAHIGGQGINLIRNFIDDCNYERQDDKNILTLSAGIKQKR